MHLPALKRVALLAWLAFAAFCLPSLHAQLVSSGITGTLRDADGRPVAGATVTAVHVPTNATFRAATSEQGRFVFRGVPVGGPFTVSAAKDGAQSQPIEGLDTLLGSEIEVNLTMKSDVVVLERFVATASRSELDAGAKGSGMVLGSERLAGKPTSERSLADMISASPLATLRETFGDREESQITAVGQNNRYNSIQIDGSRINDLFGLNATGLASFFNPLSLDTLEQLTVQISPYDVRQSGFTGASINAVTKSGTNEFKGSVYTYFRGDELFGIKMQGYNPRENFLNGTKFTPRLERSTFGATLGGPIIKDKLFFFVAYEDFESIIAGRDPRLAITNEQQILTRLGQISQAAGKTIAWGTPITGQTANTSMDEKINAKVDWNINADHRLTVRYTTTEGEIPQFGNFGGTTSLNGVNSGITATSDGHFYSQTREEKTWAGQLNSQWTDSLKTEIRYSTTIQDQQTPLNTVAPMILIAGLTGTDLVNNSTITNGSYVAGTEQFRHGNVIGVDSTQLSAVADYIWRDFVFTAGFEREESDFYNLFRQGSYGRVAYRTLADFLADTNAVIERNVYDPNVRNVADISSMATNGLFAQTRWDVNRRLSITAGLRYEFAESATPPFNQAFATATGFRNDGSLDGTSTISPRIGFNLALDDERRSQVRGGVGHFFGRAPWVIFSNSWNNTGVGGFTLLSAQNQLPTTLTEYLRNNFDPANPIGTGTDNPTLRREVNWVDDGTELPQSWRANLAWDYRLSFLDSTFTAEIVHSKVDQALFVTNENLRTIGRGADGRVRFAGNPGTQANAKFAGYTALIRVQNTDVGDSTYVSFQWSRPVRNKWGFDLAYTRGEATEAQSIGQTTAGGQWFRNAAFNQNTIEKGTADFEIKDRVQLSLTRQFEFIKNWRTTASLYYEGRTGNPYSWVFGGDPNGDGVSFNDRASIPDGPTDPRFDFSGMTAAQLSDMMAFIDSSELAPYKGGISPKNGFTEPWVNRLDLKFVQNIPLSGRFRAQVFFDFVNLGAFLSKSTFGYTEIAPFLSNGVFRTRTLTGTTTYGTDGRVRPTYTAAPVGFNIDNGMSRWRIQLGAKLLF
jgi:hypothetical protein